MYNNLIIIINLFIRQVSRRTGTAVSYKEESEEGTDSEDLVEVEESNTASAEPDNAETIEQILGQRVGKKGGWFVFYMTLCLDINRDIN